MSFGCRWVVGILGTALIVQGVDFPIGLHSLGLGAGLAFSATIMATGLLIAIAKIGASDAAPWPIRGIFAALFSVMFLGPCQYWLGRRGC